MKAENVCLIVTGCISPNINVPNLHIKDVEVRRNQYINSLDFYISHTDLEYIIFCDNSDSYIDNDLVDCAKKCNKKFEWLSFRGNTDKVIKLGKGYGEGEILEYVIENSQVLKRCDYFIKITGRLIVKNIDCLVHMIKPKTHLRIDREYKFADTRIFACSTSIYRALFEYLYLEVNEKENICIENLFAEKASEHDVVDFPIEPNIEGMSGSTGVIYEKGRVRIIVKSFMLWVKYKL